MKYKRQDKENKNSESPFIFLLSYYRKMMIALFPDQQHIYK